VRLRSFLAYDLTDPQRTQPADKWRPQNQRYEECGPHPRRRTERDVAEDVEHDVLIEERLEQVIEHLLSSFRGVRAVARPAGLVFLGVLRRTRFVTLPGHHVDSPRP
jgi:hypothetical protein